MRQRRDESSLFFVRFTNRPLPKGSEDRTPHEEDNPDPDRLLGHSDLVVPGAAFDRGGADTALSAGGDDVPARRAGRRIELACPPGRDPVAAPAMAGLGARHGGAVHLSLRLFLRHPVGAAGGSQPDRLSLAAADRRLCRLPAGRKAEAASCRRRCPWPCRAPSW